MSNENIVKIIQDASVDAQSLSEFMYKPADFMVERRLAPAVHTFDYYLNALDGARDNVLAELQSIKDDMRVEADNAIAQMFENGGLPATPFATKALMTASTLVDGDYAQVTDDATNNGLYLKTAGAWVKSAYDPLGLLTNYVDSNKLANPQLLSAEDNLDDIKESGIFIQNSASRANPELNYPVKDSGVLRSYKTKSSTYVLQIFTARSGDTYSRVWGTSWGSWTLSKFSVGITDINSDLQARITTRPEWLFPDDTKFTYDPETKTLSWNRAIMMLTNVAGNGRANFAAASISLDSDLDFQVLYVDLSKLPTDGSTITDPMSVMGFTNYNSFKDYNNQAPIVKRRSANGRVVACAGFAPIENTTGGSADIESPNDLFSFTKSADNLEFYQKSGGDNAIKLRLMKKYSPDTQLDVWGMTTAQEVDANGVVVRDITSNGVWECALKDIDNANDHSGGSHGDEIKQSVVFIIDGQIVDESSTVSGHAKEIKFAQKSEIYVQDSQTKMADKVVEWTFTADKLNMRQTITPVVGRRLTSTWVAMLPVLRKANPNNTGEQITDREVRSTDWEVVDVSEPNFVRRVQDVKEGDNITLSGIASKVSTSLRFNKLDLPSPQFYVQENIQFNKIYVSASTVNVSRVISEGEKWFIDVDYVIKTNN